MTGCKVESRSRSLFREPPTTCARGDMRIELRLKRRQGTSLIFALGGRGYLQTLVRPRKEIGYISLLIELSWNILLRPTLSRTHGTPQELGAALTARLMKREWDVVAQLAYQLQNKQVEGAGEKLLTDLVDNAKKQAGNASRNLLSFASRCLEFLVPSPKTVREIANTCISETFSRIGDASNPTETMGNLLQATEENLAPISDCIEKRLIAGIEEPEEAKSVAAITLAGRLAWTVSQTSAGFGNRSDIHIRWNPVSRKVVDACAARIGELAPQSFEVASIGFEHEIVSLAQIIEWYGAEGLFRDFVYLIFPNIFMVSIAYKYVMSAIGGEGADLADGQGAYYNEIVMCGQYLLKAPRPWWKTRGGLRIVGTRRRFIQWPRELSPVRKCPLTSYSAALHY